MLKKIIVFDFDDTLVSTNPVFDAAKEKFVDLMHVIGLYHEDILEIINKYDIEMVKQHQCFAKVCFPSALVKTYEHYCHIHKRIPEETVKEKAYQIGMWVFEQEPEVFEHAGKTLKDLAEHYQLILLTKGEEEHQKEKIRTSGLADFFVESIVVPDKNKHVFENIIARHGAKPRESWSIGNSIKADINPALQTGMNAIWVQGPTWDFEHEEPIKLVPFVKNLNEIPPIVLKETIRRQSH